MTIRAFLPTLISLILWLSLWMPLSVTAQTSAADIEAIAKPYLGLWQTVDDETGELKSVVELSLQKQRLYGTIVALFRAADEDPDPVCKKCQGVEKNKKIIGLQILKGLRWNGETWTKGTILDPAKGKHYDTQIWLQDDQLKVRGYLGIFFRTQTWKRQP